jgi:hypothetical protein
VFVFGRIVLFFVVMFAAVLLPIEVFVLFVEFEFDTVLLLIEVLVGLTVELFVLVVGFIVFV